MGKYMGRKESKVCLQIPLVLPLSWYKFLLSSWYKEYLSCGSFSPAFRGHKEESECLSCTCCFVSAFNSK